MCACVRACVCACVRVCVLASVRVIVILPAEARAASRPLQLQLQLQLQCVHPPPMFKDRDLCFMACIHVVNTSIMAYMDLESN